MTRNVEWSSPRSLDIPCWLYTDQVTLDSCVSLWDTMWTVGKIAGLHPNLRVLLMGSVLKAKECDAKNTSSSGWYQVIAAPFKLLQCLQRTTKTRCTSSSGGTNARVIRTGATNAKKVWMWGSWDYSSRMEVGAKHLLLPIWSKHVRICITMKLLFRRDSLGRCLKGVE